MDSMDRYYNMSMVDVAYELMTKKKTAVNFYKLWNEVCQMKKMFLKNLKKMWIQQLKMTIINFIFNYKMKREIKSV